MLLYFGVLALPPAFVGAFLPLGWLPQAVAALCLALGIGDGIWALRQGRGVSLQFPQRLNLVRGRQGALALVLHASGGRAKPVAVRLGLELPAGLSAQAPLTLSVPASGAGVPVPFLLKGNARGVFRPGRCVLRRGSPLGLWSLQTAFEVATEIHVYPSLSRESKGLAALLLNRNENRHLRRQVGQGREFEKLRHYLPGDSLGDIHWKATAKRSRLIVKEFQIERSQEVYAVLDASRLSGRSGGAADGGEESLLERYLSAALILGLAARRQGDQFGCAAFSDRPEGFLRAQGGKLAFARCRELLYKLQTREVSPDYDEMVSFLCQRLHRRALILVMTSLDEPLLAENFLKSIRVLSRRHLVLVGMVRPAGAQPLFRVEPQAGSAGSPLESAGPRAESPDIYRELGGHLLWHTLRELKESLRLKGVEFLLMENERFCSEMVSGYLNVKRRQIL